jgi:triacylglycerol esterase/lipase EstA (alpha/beta hydrolase family)
VAASCHIVFLVHGYGATSLTMLQFELTLRYMYPQLLVANSKFNEDRTEDNFANMGKRLATEVEMFVSSQKCGDGYGISFIAHSLGGLIVRSALTQMEHQRYHLKNFITLATPHLGHLFHNSAINRLGMWAFAKLRQSAVMASLLLA